MNKKFNSLKIFGARVDRVKMEEVHNFLNGAFLKGKFHHVVTPNPEILLLAKDNPTLKLAINNSSLSIPDGVGVVWAGELLQKSFSYNIFIGVSVFTSAIWSLLSLAMGNFRSTVFPERVSGSDLVLNFLPFAEEKGWRVFLLGGSEESSKLALEKLKIQYQNLEVEANFGGTINSFGLGDRDSEICKKINDFSPHLLIISFGAPKQELWIENNKKHLFPLIAISAGGTVDFIAGLQQRSPHLLRSRWEWLWRVFRQPSRFSRIYLAVIVFPITIVREKVAMIQLAHGKNGQ